MYVLDYFIFKYINTCFIYVVVCLCACVCVCMSIFMLLLKHRKNKVKLQKWWTIRCGCNKAEAGWNTTSRDIFLCLSIILCTQFLKKSSFVTPIIIDLDNIQKQSLKLLYDWLGGNETYHVSQYRLIANYLQKLTF